MPKRIKTSVVACIIDAEERVLLTRRGVPPFHGLWIMPGGKIEHGESILSALHREVYEEIGIRIRVRGLIDVYEHVATADNPDHFVILYYRATPLALDLAPDGVECHEAIWCAAGDLPTYELAPGARYVLGKVFPDLTWEDQPLNEDLCSLENPLACDPSAGG